MDSKRGRYGGYFLKIPANRIRFGNVIRLIDGPLAPIACVSQTAYQPCTCPDEAHCGLHMLMPRAAGVCTGGVIGARCRDSVDVGVIPL